MTTSLRTLAATCGAEIAAGDPDSLIHGAANTDEAVAGELTFVASPKHTAKLASTRASAVIVPKVVAGASARAGLAVLVAADPEMAFIACLHLLYPPKPIMAGVSDEAAVDASANIGTGTAIGTFATVGAHTVIGKDCVIHPGCRIGADVTIGDGCILYPNVVLYDGVTLGERVTIHAGTVIGSDGFGYKFRNGEHVKFPQVGTVVIGSNVEIGANTCIDRASLGATRIGDGTKIDNQVHIAHNVRIGARVLLCGQVGIGGSTVIEDYALLASQSGIADHVTVGKQAVVLAQAGVTKDVAPKAEVMGFPAADRRQALHRMATLNKVTTQAKLLDEIVALLPALRNTTTKNE